MSSGSKSRSTLDMRSRHEERRDNANPATDRPRPRSPEGSEYEAALQELAPYEEIAQQLIAFRVEHGLSQTELAVRSGVTRPAVARLERGEQEPWLPTLRRVARARRRPRPRLRISWPQAETASRHSVTA